MATSSNLVLDDFQESIYEDAQLPFRHFMPLEGTSFDKYGKILYTTPGLSSNILTFTIPANAIGVIKGIGQGVDLANTIPVFEGDSTFWSVNINGIPYIDWGNVTVQRGSISELDLVTIDLPTGCTVTVNIISAINNITVSTRVKGWFWVDRDTRR